MRLIKKMIHPSLADMRGTPLERRSARGIILDKDNILLIFTKRYNDYSFPGGGVEPHEGLQAGLQRELAEETGASCVDVIREFGCVDEFRPSFKPEYDFVHMKSYFYVCKIAHDFDNIQLEDYEVANGSRPVWVDIRDAIAHNKAVMEKQESTRGFSIERETYVLERILQELYS